MHIASSTIALELAKRSLYRLPDEARQVTVRSGTVWVTQGDDPRDIILEPGQSYVSDGHSHVVLYALNPASFTVHSGSRKHAPAWRPLQGRAKRGLVLE